MSMPEFPPIIRKRGRKAPLKKTGELSKDEPKVKKPKITKRNFPFTLTDVLDFFASCSLTNSEVHRTYHKVNLNISSPDISDSEDSNSNNFKPKKKLKKPKITHWTITPQEIYGALLTRYKLRKSKIATEKSRNSFKRSPRPVVGNEVTNYICQEIEEIVLTVSKL